MPGLLAAQGTLLVTASFPENLQGGSWSIFPVPYRVLPDALALGPGRRSAVKMPEAGAEDRAVHPTLKGPRPTCSFASAFALLSVDLS